MCTRLFPPYYSIDYSTSPVADWLKDFSDWLETSGYCRTVVRVHMSIVRHALERQAPVPRSSCFSSADLDRIFTFPVKPKRFRRSQRVFERFLQSCEQWIEAPRTGQYIELLDDYHEHLQEMRGLATETVAQHIRLAQKFLNEALPASEGLAGLSAQNIERFITNNAKRVCRSTLQNQA
ncbi:MAG: hypothetical protein GY806_12650, partial [Gammaproteobacteria bacterium]|nr:hypothetical protein [Gammaproteobacteria bacterium]